MLRTLVLLLPLLLAACGADGDPVAPSAAAPPEPAAGLSISGQAAIGITTP